MSSAPSSSAVTPCSTWRTAGSTRSLGGTGRFLLLAGEAGVGKTRLLGAIERRATAAGFATVRGGAYPSDIHVAGAILIDLARSIQRQPAFCGARREIGGAARRRRGRGRARSGAPTSSARPRRRGDARRDRQLVADRAVIRGHPLERRPDPRGPRGDRPPRARDPAPRHRDLPQRRTLPAGTDPGVAITHGRAARRGGAPRRQAQPGRHRRDDHAPPGRRYARRPGCRRRHPRPDRRDPAARRGAARPARRSRRARRRLGPSSRSARDRGGRHPRAHRIGDRRPRRPLPGPGAVIGRSFDLDLLVSVTGLDPAELSAPLAELADHFILLPAADTGPLRLPPCASSAMRSTATSRRPTVRRCTAERPMRRGVAARSGRAPSSPCTSSGRAARGGVRGRHRRGGRSGGAVIALGGPRAVRLRAADDAGATSTPRSVVGSSRPSARVPPRRTTTPPPPPRSRPPEPPTWTPARPCRRGRRHGSARRDQAPARRRPGSRAGRLRVGAGRTAEAARPRRALARPGLGPRPCAPAGRPGRLLHARSTPRA